MEVSARFDAMMAASNQCTSAGVKLFDIQRAVGHACILAASATGDAGADRGDCQVLRSREPRHGRHD
jgi:hypothetical protein